MCSIHFAIVNQIYILIRACWHLASRIKNNPEVSDDFSYLTASKVLRLYPHWKKIFEFVACMRHWPKNVVWWWSWWGFFLAKTQYFVTLHENRFGLTSPKPPVRIYCFVWLLRGEKIVKILSQWWIVLWLAMLQLFFDFHSSVTFH